MANNFPEVGAEAVLKNANRFFRDINKMSKSMGNVGKAGKLAGKGVAVLSAALTAVAVVAVAVVAAVAAIAVALGGVILLSTKTAASFESAFVGILKTTDGLGDGINDLSKEGEVVLKQFRDLAKQVPVSFEQVARIGEIAGQLGVGSDALAGFTKAIIDLGVSTDLTFEEAAKSVATIANIFQVSTEDFVDFTRSFGSAIVELGNNFNTTEPRILAFAERIAAAGKIAGFTAADIVGIGAAFTSVGIEAGAGGLAVQKVIIALTESVSQGGEELEKFAEVAGVTVQEFSDLFAEDAAGAFDLFVQGLAASGQDAFAILDELGISDQRITRAFLSVAGAGDLLTRSIDSANEALSEGTSLAEEADKFYGTFNSQLEITKNKFRDMAFVVGRPFLDLFAGILEAVGPLIDAFTEGLEPAIETIFEALREDLLPALKDLAKALGFDFKFDPKKITKGVKEAGKKIGEFITRVSELITAFTEGGFEGLLLELGVDQEQVDKIREVLDRVVAMFEEQLPLIVENIEGIIEEINALWEEWGPTVTAIVGGALLLIIATISSFFLILSGIVRAALQLLNGDFAGAWQTIKDTLAGFLESILQLVGTNTEEFLTVWSQNWENFKTIIRLAWENIKIAVSTGIANVKEAIVTKLQEIITTWRENWELLKEIVTTIIDNTRNAVVQKISGFVQLGKDIVNGMIQGLTSAAGALFAAITKLVKDALAAAAAALGASSPSKESKKLFTSVGTGAVLGLEDVTSDVENAFANMASDSLSAGATAARGVGGGGDTNIDRSSNISVDANYSVTQSPITIADDLALFAAANL